MSMFNKDIHGDREQARVNQQEVLIQQFAAKERKQRLKEETLNNELDILTQINDSLEQATKKRQHVIYKQRQVVSEALKD